MDELRTRRDDINRKKQRLQLDVDAKNLEITRYDTLIDQSDKALNKMI